MLLYFITLSFMARIVHVRWFLGGKCSLLLLYVFVAAPKRMVCIVSTISRHLSDKSYIIVKIMNEESVKNRLVVWIQDPKCIILKRWVFAINHCQPLDAIDNSLRNFFTKKKHNNRICSLLFCFAQAQAPPLQTICDKFRFDQLQTVVNVFAPPGSGWKQTIFFSPNKWVEKRQLKSKN